MNRVFLGGTCANTTWRDTLVNMLDVDSFNPVVEDWNEACQDIEEAEKMYRCNIHLYVITSAMQGVFSIAEVIESAMTPNKVTIFHVMPEGFADGQNKSLLAVCKMVQKHGGISYVDNDIRKSARVINNCFADTKI